MNDVQVNIVEWYKYYSTHRIRKNENFNIFF